WVRSGQKLNTAQSITKAATKPANHAADIAFQKANASADPSAWPLSKSNQPTILKRMKSGMTHSPTNQTSLPGSVADRPIMIRLPFRLGSRYRQKGDGQSV